MLGWLRGSRPSGAPSGCRSSVRIVAGGLAAIGGVLALVVNPWFAALPAFIGSGLVFSGVTDTCTMAMVLAKLPYNRPPASDVRLMIRELTAGRNLEPSA